MCRQQFTVIGISDSRHLELPRQVFDIIGTSTVFSGGRRHHEIVAHLLPQKHEWIEVTVPLSEVYARYKSHSHIVVFASGDPLFYGFGTTLRREFPDAAIKVYPSFNSLQMLAHRLVLSYQDMVNVSVTGRPWKGLDDSLIAGHSLIGVLTDRRKGPAEIAARMLRYGYDNYTITVGESLGNDEMERVSGPLQLSEACDREWSYPNCLLLRQTTPRPHRLGLPEGEFHHLDGREKMITKMPIRLLSLSMLDLGQRHTLWDIGFCTGSVSIEARRQFPHLDIIAFERREECRELLQLNCERHGAPDITGIIGDFFEADLSACPQPDTVFIGGHGGRLPEMLTRIYSVMQPGGVIVFNSVSPETCLAFEQSVRALGHTVTERHTITLDTHNPITILKAI